jgi:UDPglucose 6-dehydrogenase
MDSHPVSVAGSQGDASTAPTTPEGSLSFSPVIHATQGTNGVDDGIETSLNRRSRRAIAASGVPTVDQIRRICCVGAGYVGV